jgi:hypothetical protein
VIPLLWQEVKPTNIMAIDNKEVSLLIVSSKVIRITHTACPQSAGFYIWGSLAPRKLNTCFSGKLIGAPKESFTLSKIENAVTNH